MANNILARGTYSTATLFSDPWPFYIIDDFLSPRVIELLEKLYNHPAFEIVDSFHNGCIFNPSQVQLHHKIKRSLPLYKDTNLSKLISDCVITKLSRVVDCNNQCMPDLVKCDPGYRYNAHKDHPGKKSSIVVFLDPANGDGTTLLDNRKGRHEILWKQNRALIFNQHQHGLHEYVNTGIQTRITLNLYMVDQIWPFGVDTK